MVAFAPSCPSVPLHQVEILSHAKPLLLRCWRIFDAKVGFARLKKGARDFAGFECMLIGTALVSVNRLTVLLVFNIILIATLNHFYRYWDGFTCLKARQDIALPFKVWPR